MSKSVAVVCAFPPVRNTGMATVDYSAHITLSRLFPDAVIDHYLLPDPAFVAYGEKDLPFHYRSLLTDWERLRSSDAIVLWGDFLQSRHFLNTDLKNHLQKHVGETGWSRDMAYELLLLAKEDETLLSKVVVFGSTIITNGAGDLIDANYRSALRRLLVTARGIFFRDALSATQASALRPDAPTLGMDCAFLPTDAEMAELPDFHRRAPQGRLGVFFGRTPHLLLMARFARSMGRATGLQTHWLPWFPTGSRKRRALLNLAGFKATTKEPSPGAILSEVSTCNLIVTDTYHVCVNAWRLGIPAICIGSGIQRRGGTLGDLKKEILYAMYGASDLYVRVEEIGGKDRTHVAEKIAGIIHAGEHVPIILGTLAAHRRTSLARLTSSLAPLLNA